MLVFAEIVAVETALKRKRVSDAKLFPGYNSPRAQLVRLDFESAVFVVEEVRLLRKDPWKESDYSPAQEPAICSCVAPVEETVLFLRVTMKITVDPELPSFFLAESLHKGLDAVDFRVKFFIRRDPLPVEINS